MQFHNLSNNHALKLNQTMIIMIIMLMIHFKNMTLQNQILMYVDENSIDRMEN